MVKFNPTLWAFRWWRTPSTSLGDLWEPDNAQKAYEAHELRSKSIRQGGLAMRLAFRNTTPIPLIICWISENGDPRHFYTLKPNSTIPEDDPDMVTTDDKIERTSLGHAFTFSAHCNPVDVKKKHLDPTTLIGGYRPMHRSTCGKGSDASVHIVTIAQKPASNADCCPRPWGVARLRKRSVMKSSSEQNEFVVSVREGRLDPTPLDTSGKHYDEAILGGWPVRLEKNWDGGNKTVREEVEKALTYATNHLPKQVRESLQKSTPIYINRTQKYGPKVCPVNGEGWCFHPGADWLEENGMSTAKAECVEMYHSEDSLEEAQLWGPGGVVLHELSHAYHWKCLKDGYDNKEIKECYDKAMKEKLYERVKVHEVKGGSTHKRAYACTDQMEYFAELSTAFLGGLDETEEYNKWFPFNREQLKKHDPRAYKMLQRVWKVNCDDGP